MTPLNRDPQDLLPLSENVWRILMVLGDGQAWHGYAINKQVEAETQGQLKFGAATLYRTIHTMLADGLIAEIDPPPDEADERRRYYKLSGFGRRVVQAQIAWFNERIQVARQKPAFGAGLVLGGL